MEPHYLLDTNICIYIRRKKPEQVLRRFRKLRPGEAVLSVITCGELLSGAAKSPEATYWTTLMNLQPMSGYHDVMGQRFEALMSVLLKSCPLNSNGSPLTLARA